MPTPALEQLYQMVKDHPHCKKVLITRSFAQGYQWLHRISRKLGPVVNVEVQTPLSLILAQAQLELSVAGVEYIPPEETYWLTQSAMLRLGREPECYVPTSMITPGVVHSFHHAVCELRGADIQAAQLEAGQFEHAAKAEYLQKLLSDYEYRLQERDLADFASLHRFVVPYRSSADVIFAMDANIRLPVAAERMLSTICGERIIALHSGIEFEHPESGVPYGRTEFYCSLGPLAEAKEMIRRAAAAGQRWDEVECVLSDYRSYAPVLNALCCHYEIPCTFSQGLPVNDCSLGRAALLFLDWIQSNFHIDYLLTAIKYGYLRSPCGENVQADDAVADNIIRFLETSGIGWGRERYKLDNQTDPTVGLFMERISLWLQALPADIAECRVKHAADSLALFLADCCEPHSNEDHELLHSIHRLQRTLERWGSECIGLAMSVRLIREHLEACSVGAKGIPEPGKLYISSISSGAQSGRDHTYVLGMDEQNWSVAIRQDPVLLDDERLRIHAALETSGQRAMRKRKERNRRFGGLRGACTVSFNRVKVSDLSEGSPAFEMLQLYRLHSGRPEADFDSLALALKSPAGYALSSTAIMTFISSVDFLLSELISPDRIIKDGAGAVEAEYKLLANGLKAITARRNIQAGPYDGVLSAHIQSDGLQHRHYSASKLEAYAKCPLHYFYHEVLGVRPKEAVIFDRTRWLDALQRGSLLHSIFFRYMAETLEAEGEHNRVRLRGICERELQSALSRIPAPSPHIAEKECDSIRQDVDVFWNMELRRSTRPIMFELELHKQQGVFTLELAEEITLPLRGFVDRVDEIAPHRYQIIDYKTGNPRYYKDDAFFAGGTQVQHALYALAVEQWFRTTGRDPQAEVTVAGYSFPTQRGFGEEVMRNQSQRREATIRLLRTMVSAMEGGLFPPTASPEMCRNCDYATVCGNHAEWKKGARLFPENLERLAPLLEVNASV